MKAAAAPRPRPLEERLLRIDPGRGLFEDRRLADLPELLRRGDLLVVNDAATLPASLHGWTAAGAEVEVRLFGRGDETWTAVLFGAGDWRLRTEDRPAPPALRPGDGIRFGEDLGATVRTVSALSPRLVDLAFDRGGAAFWLALYRHGRPIQYSYLQAPLALWDVQTSYGGRPWAFEPPSAGRPLTWGLLSSVRARGIGITSITHAAGISSTGDAELDARLPMDERFEVPPETVGAVERARAAGGRVVAVGTTVVRALESAASPGGVLRPVAGITRLRLGPGYVPRVADGLLTGLHEPDTSHFSLLGAFAPMDLLRAADRHAEDEGYLCHEFGDSCLLLPHVGRGRASSPSPARGRNTGPTC
jgi:S-adenosylmethionine:tRNA ribosyltransferase-isomerase